MPVELIMLGTGHALTTECYNTCFILRDRNGLFLVDCGGGNGLLKQLKQMEIEPAEIHDVFISHQHLDHITGLLWLLRVIGYKMAAGLIKEPLKIYGHQEVIETIKEMAELLMEERVKALIGDMILFIEIKDAETVQIIGHSVTFFDIHSTKIRQFGFTFQISGKKVLVFLGDEPFREHLKPFAQGADYLLHEAFCLEKDKEFYKPHEKSHSTVIDACRSAEALGTANLILMHSKDDDYAHRKKNYLEEGKPFYSGKLYAPNDLEIIQLK